MPETHVLNADDDGAEKPGARRRWRDVVFEKFVIAALAASTLALVNHLFWNKQEHAQKQDFYFQEKVRVYSLLSGSLTKLLSDVNARIEQNAKPAGASTAAEISRLDGEIDADNTQLGLQLAYAKVYFSAAVRSRIDECRQAVGRIDRDATEYLRADSDVRTCAQALADGMAAETREEFSEVNQR